MRGSGAVSGSASGAVASAGTGADVAAAGRVSDLAWSAGAMVAATPDDSSSGDGSVAGASVGTVRVGIVWVSLATLNKFVMADNPVYRCAYAAWWTPPRRYMVFRGITSSARFITALLPRAINDAQGWCRVMTYIESLLVGSVVLGGLRSPWPGYHRTGAGLDLGDDAGGRRSPDDVVSAVVLAGDAVEGLDVDGVGSANGRFQLGAAGNAVGHGSHLLLIWVSCRDCSQNLGQLSLRPGERGPRTGEPSRLCRCAATNCPGVVVQHRTSIGVRGDFFDKGDPEPFAIHWPLDHEKTTRDCPGCSPVRPASRGGCRIMVNRKLLTSGQAGSEFTYPKDTAS